MIEAKDCTGCAACAAVCPVDAITMWPDDHGFLHPRINAVKCIHCSRCDKICEKLHMPYDGKGLGFYGAFSKDKAVRHSSTSGGLFMELARWVLSKNGVVFGCAMSADQCSAQHIMVDTEEELPRLQGSKYLQSNVGNSYRIVKEKLKNGQIVLYTGTPCQIAGLRSYLGDIDSENLYLIDIICHGVPSPMVWNRYLNELEHEKKSRATSVSFRDKEFGWSKYSLKVKYSNNTMSICRATKNPYFRGFISDLYLRSACHSCTFKNKNYHSDITLGDFWGAESVFPEITDDEGISLAIPHTQKGVDFLNDIALHAELHQVTEQIALENNPAYYYPSIVNRCSRGFWKDFNKNNPFEIIVEKYCGQSFMAKLRRHFM